MEKTRKAMTLTLAIAMSLPWTACGAASNAPAFINQTGMQEADFQTLAETKWKQAQTQTSSQWIDLWAAYRVIHNLPADPECYTGQLFCNGFIPPIPAAASLEPRGVVVVAVPDVTAGTNTPNHQTNPTGIIHCGAGYCEAYVVFNPCKINIPASRPNNMGPYEMQNCILQKLGLDVSRR